jgi:DNA helicase-2/ATP-dependent DNA helicase PcrA
MASSLLANLNPEQLAAVTLPHASALILAGAGSGKTRVLTTRIAWLLRHGQASPLLDPRRDVHEQGREGDADAALRDDADAHARHVARHLPRPVQPHAARTLPAPRPAAGVPDPGHRRTSSADQALSTAHANIDDEPLPARQLQHFIGNAKEQGLRPNAVERSTNSRAGRSSTTRCTRPRASAKARGFRRAAAAQPRAARHARELREHYRRRFSHLLSTSSRTPTCCSTSGCGLLPGRRPRCSPSATTTSRSTRSAAQRREHAALRARLRQRRAAGALIKLEQNYRSHGHILDAANALIKHNQTRLGKNCGRDEARASRCARSRAPSDLDEASFVVECVKGLVDDGRRRSDEVALLYRSNAQSRVLEHALFNAALPYRVYGGMRFFERAEIKHALAYLRLVAIAGGRRRAACAWSTSRRAASARARSSNCRTRRARRARRCGTSPAPGRWGARPAARSPAFVRLIDGMREATRSLPLSEAVAHVVEASGLLAHYRQDREGQERIENLEELVNAARASCARPTSLWTAEFDGPCIGTRCPRIAVIEEVPGSTAALFPSGDRCGAERRDQRPSWRCPKRPRGREEGATDELTAFLAHAAPRGRGHAGGRGPPALQLMTVHSAKGLEFHTVFVTGLEEGLFPHENSMNAPDGVEEERRLMYVAITRARRKLYLTHAQTRMLHGQTRYNIVSRFLDEIPRELVQWLSPQTRRSAYSSTPRMGRRAEPSAGHAAAPAWRIGQSVRHAKFGVGVIIEAEGRGDDARVQVNSADAA